MDLKIWTYKEGETLEHTNATGATEVAGTPVAIGSGAGIVLGDLANGDSDDVLVASKLLCGVKDASVIAAGDRVGYDNNGDPVGGTAGSGAITSDPAKIDIPLGVAEYAADAEATQVIFRLNGLGKQAHVANAAAATAVVAVLTAVDPELDASDITDSTAGVASVAHELVAPAGADYVTAELKANFATVAAEYNALKDDTEALETSLEQAIDDGVSQKAILDALITDVDSVRTAVNAILLVIERAGLTKTA